MTVTVQQGVPTKRSRTTGPNRTTKVNKEDNMVVPGILCDKLDWLKYGKKVRKNKYGVNKLVGSDEVWRHYFQVHDATYSP